MDVDRGVIFDAFRMAITFGSDLYCCPRRVVFLSHDVITFTIYHQDCHASLWLWTFFLDVFVEGTP